MGWVCSHYTNSVLILVPFRLLVLVVPYCHSCWCFGTGIDINIGIVIGVGGTICAVAGGPTVSSHTFAGTQMLQKNAPPGQGSM